MIEIKINGISYKNVSSITPSFVYDYYYSLQTMDGKTHKKVKGKKTNYSIVFFNINSSVYEALQEVILNNEIVSVEIPVGANTTKTSSYFAEITGNKIKGYLSNGNNYLTGLTITLEAVDYDE